MREQGFTSCSGSKRERSPANPSFSVPSSFVRADPQQGNPRLPLSSYVHFFTYIKPRVRGVETLSSHTQLAARVYSCRGFFFPTNHLFLHYISITFYFTLATPAPAYIRLRSGLRLRPLLGQMSSAWEVAYIVCGLQRFGGKKKYVSKKGMHIREAGMMKGLGLNASVPPRDYRVPIYPDTRSSRDTCAHMYLNSRAALGKIVWVLYANEIYVGDICW